jgi:hypothetical protein
MDAPRLTTGDLIACAGAVLVGVSLFLPWYEVRLEIAEFSLSNTGTGREALGPIFVILIGIAAVAIAVVAAHATGAMPDEVPVPAVLLGLGGLAVLLVLYRIIDIPVDGKVADEVELSRRAGIFIALTGSAAVAYGGWREHTPERPTAARGKGRRRRVGAEGKA